MRWTAEDFVWRQVADYVAKQIGDGAYPAGSVLPGETALAEELEVSKGTVRHAMAELRSRGLIRTLHGHGSVVASQPGPAETSGR